MKTYVTICQTCNKRLAEDTGFGLDDSLREKLAPSSEVEVTLSPCMSAGCDATAAIAIRSQAKMTWVFNNITHSNVADVVDFVANYSTSENGMVNKDSRPQSLKKAAAKLAPCNKM